MLYEEQFLNLWNFMPIYEYQCSKCGIFEVIQKASDKKLKSDPECGHKNCPRDAVRVISESAFHLKGGGWYKTDYAKSGGASENSKKSTDKKSSDTAGSADSAKSETSKTDSKSETTTEKKSLKIKGNGGGCKSGCGCH